MGSAAGRTGGTKRLIAAGGGLAGALGTAGCCVIPFVLIGLGAGGAWIGALRALAPYQPYFAGLALGSVGAGFYFVYRKPRGCARRPPRRLLKALLWGALALVALALAFPYLIPLIG